MNIEISQKEDGSYMADCADLVGSPPIGLGTTKDEALGNLIRRMGKEIIGKSGLTWSQKYYNLDINFQEIEAVPRPDEIWDNVLYTENW